MIKKSIYLFTALSICSITICTGMREASCDDVSETSEFTDIFDVEDEEEILLREHDSEEIEIESLEEFAVKPTPPSQATVLMRQMGIKMLIGYIAMRTYFESMWSNVKVNAARLRSWVMREQNI